MSDTDAFPPEPEMRKAFGQPLTGLYDGLIITAHYTRGACFYRDVLVDSLPRSICGCERRKSS